MARLSLRTAGESHGPALVAILDGLPHGLAVPREAIDRDLGRRQLGFGRGGRQKIERDQVEVLAGLRGGRTIGAPLALVVRNRDFDSWRDVMDPFAPAASGPGAGERAAALTRPRPGHVDLAGALKLGLRDARDVLERSSARSTAARVAAGAVCKALLGACGIELFGHVVRIGEVAVAPDATDAAMQHAEAAAHPTEPATHPTEAAAHPTEAAPHSTEAAPHSTDAPNPTDAASQHDHAALQHMRLTAMRERAERAPGDVRCADHAAAARMVDAVRAAQQAGDSLGGVVEVIAWGVPPGLGSHAEWDARLDGRLAQALMSIQAIKAVEVGLGLEAAARRGSAVHDPIAHDGRRFVRPTNNAGGIEGGITNGEPVVVRAAMKPIPTLARPLGSVDLVTHAAFSAQKERTDSCAVPAAAVVAEAAVAFVLADALLGKTGGDTMDEVLAHLHAYRAALEAR